MAPDEVARRARDALRNAPRAACIVDLQGSKMRIGAFEAREVREGEVVRFALSSDGGGVSLPHPELFASVSPGERLTLDDGKLEGIVEDVTPSLLSVRMLTAGWLRPRKGINRPRHPVEPAGLCDADKAVLDACCHIAGIDYAISFVRDGREAQWVRAHGPRRIVLKIEREEAVHSLHSISTTGDEIWICRGDLGAQLGLEAMARAVHDIDRPRIAVPVLLAGQVLEHLTAHSEPTRSEVCHIHDVLLRGFDGVVLSDETAIGVDPENAVRWAARLLRGLGPARRRDD
jgi:pyruvate kinase